MIEGIRFSELEGIQELKGTEMIPVVDGNVNKMVKAEKFLVSPSSNEIEVTETQEAPTDPSVELWAELTDDPSDVIESTPIVNHGVGDLEFAITPNVYHVWGEVASLKLTQALVEDGDLDIYMFEFISGASATSLTYPIEWKWLNGTPTINPNKRYQIGVSRNLAKIDEYEK